MHVRRLVLSMLAIAMTALVVTTASFALFTASTTNANNVFTTGTVAVNGLSGCDNTFNNIAPGDHGTFPCTVTYTGSLDAWLGLNSAFGGALTNCDGANSLQVAITEGATTFANSGIDQLVGAAPYHTGNSVTFTVNWNLPLAAGNSCQAKSATLTLMVDAVQSRNNSAVPGPGPVMWH
jgi:spore coat-associated protein N